MSSLLSTRLGGHSNRQLHARRSPGVSETWPYVRARAYGLLPGFQVILLKKIIAPERRSCGVRLYETQQSNIHRDVIWLNYCAFVEQNLNHEQETRENTSRAANHIQGDATRIDTRIRIGRNQDAHFRRHSKRSYA